MLLDWARGSALPLWADAGFDREHGRFEERLTFDAARLPEVPIRLLTQARQIFVYALAAKRGWHAGAAGLVDRAFASMVRDFRGRDGRGGWIFSIHRDGAVADPSRDFYAHAFVLLAVASYVEATGKRATLDVADQTLAFLDRCMAAREGGGFVEALPPIEGPRRQNPHMHLFEALLHLWTCSGEARYRARLDRLFDLFALRFFRRGTGVVGEYFSASLQPADGIAGKLVEPGHHYEWIWLLRWYETVSGTATDSYVDALYAHADRYGFDGAGMIVDEILVDGTHHTRSRRLWPIAEAIKANMVEARRGRPQSAAKATALAHQLRDRFLTARPAGGWIDRLDPTGAPATQFMPASTLYHLMGAIDEFARHDLPDREPQARS